MHASLGRLSRVLVVVAMLAVMLAAAAACQPQSTFAAGTQWWGAKNLPGYTWTGSGYYIEHLYYEFGEGETGSSVCVGPVVKNGSGGFYAPWGWKCQNHATAWEHSDITGMAAFYNPNPGTISAIRNYFSWH